MYEVIDQLFAKADKNNDTVKSIVQSVANHFHLSKVDKSTKKIIKTMLIYLASIQSLNTGGTEGGSREASPPDTTKRGGEGGSVGGGTAQGEGGSYGGRDGGGSLNEDEELEQQMDLEIEAVMLAHVTTNTLTGYMSRLVSLMIWMYRFSDGERYCHLI